MQRRTKILVTLGPATDDPAKLKKMLAAGVDAVRLNFSHGSVEDHTRRATMVREAAAELDMVVGILADLQGPKIRIESFTNGPVELLDGQTFVLDTALDPNAGDQNMVGCAYKELPQDVVAGDTLLLNDGAIVMGVDAVDLTRIVCTVQIGGWLSNRKGINKQGGGLSAAALTDKDRADIRTAAALNVDFIAVSFPRSAADMDLARALVREAGSDAALVAKIERAEALPVLRELIAASDVVMVARGDLGVEIGDAELPGWQKRIIAESREQNKMAITATQMMESMITNPIPTRAEVLDVANAVMDGTDAVMLSGETSVGRYPIETVRTMSRIVTAAEEEVLARGLVPLDEAAKPRTQSGAVARAAAEIGDFRGATLLVVFTQSGDTARRLSRYRSPIPLIAFTPDPATPAQLTLTWGVETHLVPTAASTDEMVTQMDEQLLRLGRCRKGETVVMTAGSPPAMSGTTNLVRVHHVGEDDTPH